MMADQGWSSALMAASGVAVHGAAQDDAIRALVMEARTASLARARAIELSRRREPEIREAIAARHDCPLGVQANLLHDRRASVRIALASNKELFAAVAEELARDRDVAVLKALARSEGAPRRVLETLAGHRRDEVARLARRALDGTVVTARSLVPELEEGAREAAAAPDSPAQSPVGQRTARTYAPRPAVRRDAPPTTRWA
ncbi:hypothetical protein [Demequina lignilytica]|uniref:DUF4116 domain-containing protein n=1 Tax=Demequina lignilytica TaxID=3051663 RepID=A0AB35MGA6_9MICO|nr:hypothetical protein [Demequina sp. SYSU T0a273]MDN4482792.1 hypothetical protein [Demequina sp. SYSU T0a273]